MACSDSATVHHFLDSNIPSAALGSLSHAQNKLSRDICWETVGPFFSQTGISAMLMTSTAHESHKENCPSTPQFLWWNVYHVQPFQAHSSEVQVSANSCRDSLHFSVNKTVIKGELLKPQYWCSIVTLAWDRMPGEQWMRFQILLFTFICLSYKCNSLSPLVCETTPVCFSRCFTQITDDRSMKYTKCCNPKIMNKKKKTETKSTFIHKVNTFLEKMVKYALNKVDW